VRELSLPFFVSQTEKYRYAAELRKMNTSE
jgi:hypothetical protein